MCVCLCGVFVNACIVCVHVWCVYVLAYCVMPGDVCVETHIQACTHTHACTTRSLAFIPGCMHACQRSCPSHTV